MTKFGLYPTLAFNGLTHNKENYLPFLIACWGMAGMFYIMISLVTNPELEAMPGTTALLFMLMLGVIVIGVFSIIFMLYTNNFVMKRRQRELALYNILGLEKRHLAIVMFWEELFLALMGIAGGLFIGVLFSKLVSLLLAKLLWFESSLGFYFSVIGIIITTVLFLVIFGLILVVNIFNVSKVKPIELLHSEAGEKEPKTPWALTIIGIVTMVSGYVIAQFVSDPFNALALFFVAVILVIIGTECLFTSVSIAVLKLMKANKKFYYQKEHFTAVSGMLYRMKQNGKGLANICILCTMVLVTVSTTICLYTGSEQTLRRIYPNDINIEVSSGDYETEQQEIIQTSRDLAQKNNISIENISDYLSYDFQGYYKDGRLLLPYEATEMGDVNGYSFVSIVTLDGYQKIYGETADLSDDQILVTGSEFKENEIIKIGNYNFTVKQILTEKKRNAYITNSMLIVVKDADIISTLYNLSANSDSSGKYIENIQYDLSGTTEVKKEFSQQLTDAMESREAYIKVSSLELNRSEYYSLYGGFLFLGLFLGILFLLITGLIIYYKQVTEGYQDRQRFIIMEEVGMSQAEVKKTIRKQILMVFFLPLIVSGIHVFGSFHMIALLLQLFGLTDIKLFMLCTAITLVCFSAIYGLIYWGTARTYYRIVNKPEFD